MTDQPPDREYTTVEGDTLTSVALRFYGPGAKGEWVRIFDANMELLKGNPWYLAPGTVLRIPPLVVRDLRIPPLVVRDPAAKPEAERIITPDRVRLAALLIEEEARRAMAVHGPMRSGHEGHSVIEEESDELWEEIKKYPGHDPAKWRKEAIHLGAMALRFLVDLGLVIDVDYSHPPEED